MKPEGRIHRIEEVNDISKPILRTLAILMVIAAIAWAVEIVRQSRLTNDDGPPMGAICMALPLIPLLIGAIVIWSTTHRSLAVYRPPMRHPQDWPVWAKIALVAGALGALAWFRLTR